MTGMSDVLHVYLPENRISDVVATLHTLADPIAGPAYVESCYSASQAGTNPLYFVLMIGEALGLVKFQYSPHIVEVGPRTIPSFTLNLVPRAATAQGNKAKV